MSIHFQYILEVLLEASQTVGKRAIGKTTIDIPAIGKLANVGKLAFSKPAMGK